MWNAHSNVPFPSGRGMTLVKAVIIILDNSQGLSKQLSTYNTPSLWGMSTFVQKWLHRTVFPTQ